MRLRTEKEILAATKPIDIFSMNPKTLEDEYKEYKKSFKPQEYRELANFIVMQQVNLLYKKAKKQLAHIHPTFADTTDGTFSLLDNHGREYGFEYNYSSDFRLGRMYVSDEKVAYVLNPGREALYHNYIEKVSAFIDKWQNKMGNWNDFKHFVPNIARKFKANTGEFVIELNLPCRIYPLREILDFFGGQMNPRHVASIMKRLYDYVCRIDIAEMTHNGIMVDNIFFAPGRFVDKGETYDVGDIRIVGLYGGWFFSTWKDEKISVVPREIWNILPETTKNSRYSSFEVDMLAIKEVAKELLGESLNDLPVPMKEWLERQSCEKNAYEEFAAWEKVNRESFGKARFVDIDVSIQ